MSALIDSFSKSELRDIINDCNSVREVIDKLGYKTHTVRNYITVKNRILKYDIDISHYEDCNLFSKEKN